jgi:CBS domain-containing protein
MSFTSLKCVLDDRRLSSSPTIPVAATVAAAMTLMQEHRADVVMALDGGRFAGLFTARDAIACVVGNVRPVETIRLIDAIRSESSPIDIETDAEDALILMDQRDSHHIAVSSCGQVLGTLSRRDLSAWIIRNQQEQLDHAYRAVQQMSYSNRRSPVAG